VAVLAVMTYHSGLIRGGFLGVDMFFTLSGFLITRLLLQERAATGAINLKGFYVRRALRLLPPLIVFLLLWTCFLLVTVPPEYWGIVGGYVAAVLFYVANWAGIHGLPMGTFGHTWSPGHRGAVLSHLASRRGRAGRRASSSTAHRCLLALAAVVSFAWRLHLALGGATERRIYWATDAHADGLLIGADLAFLLAGGRRLTRAGSVASGMAFAAVVGLLGLLAAVPFNPSYAYGMSALVALATSALILEVGRPGSRVARLLEARWLVWAGRSRLSKPKRVNSSQVGGPNGSRCSGS
jgi:peptidoglycan/LPS O-acetylase OafA/YrhL